MIVRNSAFPSRMLKESMTHCIQVCNPTNAVGGAFILSLHEHGALLPNPTNAVGGSFISSLAGQVKPTPVRLGMNEPPTALVGFKKPAWSCLLGNV